MDTQYRAELDFDITFSNGGSLHGKEFRIDIAGPDLGEAELGAALVRDLGLLMVGEVRITRQEIFADRHKRAVPGPADGPSGAAGPGAAVRYADLSHVITDGMQTVPGLPVPRIQADLPLDRLADLDAIVVDVSGIQDRAITAGHFLPYDLAGKAVLLRTGWDAYWGSEKYHTGHPFLTEDAARHLATAGAVLAGIDAANIDDTGDPARPAHAVLLAAGVGVCEHLTGLAALPGSGFRFTAVPPRVAGLGTFPVRAYATWTS